MMKFNPFVRSYGDAPLEVRSSHDWLHARGEKALLESLPLTPNDRLMIGTMVQLMATCDLFARRGHELIDLSEGRGPAGEKGALRDSEVFSRLAARLPIARVEAGRKQRAIEHLEWIDGIAFYRHLLAHWSGRRSPINDCLILMTKNGREAARKTGRPLDSYELRTAVIPVPELVAATNELIRRTDDLGQLVMSWADDLEAQGLLPAIDL
jgi:hypothetical protein